MLAQRAAGRCSNPGCGKVTSGPGLDPGRAVNVGVAAHITAASPGGPRYDPALSSAERSSAAKGVWLCQTCAKLVDSDVTRYNAGVLRQWKAKAEGQAAAMLEAGTGPGPQGVELAIPSAESPGAILSFASTQLARVRRDEELAELEDFLGSGQWFTWWLWTGPAGAGKSRLAVELCRQATVAGWDAGFLREPGQERLGDLQALVPTLVVVDYAAQRAAWLGEATVRLARRGRAPGCCPVCTTTTGTSHSTSSLRACARTSSESCTSWTGSPAATRRSTRAARCCGWPGRPARTLTVPSSVAQPPTTTSTRGWPACSTPGTGTRPRPRARGWTRT